MIQKCVQKNDVFPARKREAQLCKTIDFPYAFKGFSDFGAPRIRRKTVAERSRSQHAFRTAFRDGFRTILRSQNGAKTVQNRTARDFEKRTFRGGYGPRRKPAEVNGLRRFGTIYLVILLIRSYLYIYLSIYLSIYLLICSSSP